MRNASDVSRDEETKAKGTSHLVERRSCPVCHSTRFNTLFELPYDSPQVHNFLARHFARQGPGAELELVQGGNYQVDACLDCGLVFQREIPDASLMERIYEHWFDPGVMRRKEGSDRNSHYYLWAATEIAAVLDLLDKPSGDVSFLDFGMGLARWCLIAKGFGCSVAGTELSDTLGAYATDSGIDVLPRSELSGRRFDFINAEQVFEHIADPLETLVELAGVLQPSGIVRISVPTGWNVKEQLRRPDGDWGLLESAPDLLLAIFPLEHINCFDYRVLIELGRRAGLEPVELPARPFVAKTPRDAAKLIALPAYRRMFPSLSRRRSEQRRRHEQNRRNTVLLRRTPTTA